MASYIQSVVDRVNQLDHQVILVGHSMTGTVISQVAERIPEKVERLIYVAAFLLNDGESVAGTMGSDTEGQLYPKIVFSDDQSYATVDEQTFRTVGFHDAEEQVIRRVVPQLVEKQATEPLLAKIVVSAKNFGRVPKTYIRTTLDKVTTPELQDRMIANWEVETVHNIEAGHFPAYSVPEKLAEALLPNQCSVDGKCCSTEDQSVAADQDACSIL